MSLDQDAAFLSRVPLFEYFNADQIKLIVFSAQRRTFREGALLYRQGDAGHEAHVIVSGEVEAFRSDGEREKNLGRYGTGTILGETAMIVNIERASNVRAIGDVETLTISRDVFRKMLDEYPDIARKLFAIWAERLNNTINDISALAPKFSQPGEQTRETPR